MNSSKSPAVPGIVCHAREWANGTNGTSSPIWESQYGATWSWRMTICEKRSGEKCIPLEIRRHLRHLSIAYWWGNNPMRVIGKPIKHRQWRKWDDSVDSGKSSVRDHPCGQKIRDRPCRTVGLWQNPCDHRYHPWWCRMSGMRCQKMAILPSSENKHTWWALWCCRSAPLVPCAVKR